MAVAQKSGSVLDELGVSDEVWDSGVVDVLGSLDADLLEQGGGFWRVGIAWHERGMSSLGEVSVERFEGKDWTVYSPRDSRELERKYSDAGLTFSFTIDDEIPYSDWIQRVSNVFIGRRYQSSEVFVMGLLVRPFVSEDIGSVVEHLESELVSVSERVRVVRRFAELYGQEVRRFSQDISDPVNVRGVGESTRERLVDRFGSYSNILFNSEDEIESSLSTAYGNTPDMERLISNISEAVMLFEKESDEYAVSVEDLVEFPYEPPVGLCGISCNVHTAGDEYRQ